MARRICIDAGHYGKYNRSPANNAYYESEAMWKLHLMQKKYLEEYGFEVITTRDNIANDLELTARGRKAKGCDLFISDHSNAVGSGVNESVDYVAIYRLVDDTTTKCDDISIEIGDILAPIIAEQMGVSQGYRVVQRKSENDRNGDGMMNDNYYGVLHGARTVGVPALILEHSFHTNTKATNWLLKDSNLERLAKAEAEAIAKYFGMTKEESKPTVTPTVTPTEPVKYYRVRKSWDDSKSQIGAYKVLDNAKKNCPEGYTVYDWNGNEVYSNKKVEVAPTPAPFKPYMVKIDVSEIYDKCLNIRQKPDGDSKKMGSITEDMSVTIVDEAKDPNGKVWGLLKSYAKNRNGWIRLDYTKNAK